MIDPNAQEEVLEKEEKKHNSTLNQIIRSMTQKQIIVFSIIGIILFYAKFIKNPPMENKQVLFLLLFIGVIAYLLIMKNQETDVLDLPAARRIVRKEIELIQEEENGGLAQGTLKVEAEGRSKTWKTQAGYNPSRYEIAFSIETTEGEEKYYTAEVHIKSRKLIGITERPHGWSSTEVKDFELIDSKDRIIEKRLGYK